MAKVQEEHGPIEILVNNAGITRDAMMRKLTRQMWDDVIDTNLGSCYNMCKAVWDGMSAAKFGRIVNIGSVNGQAGQLGQVNYAASKAGMVGLSKSLAAEVASRGITVNCVAPGFIETAMTKKLNENQRAGILSAVPVGRMGTPAEIAAAVVYLAAPEAGYVTGATLHVNGGMAMV